MIFGPDNISIPETDCIPLILPPGHCMKVYFADNTRWEYKLDKNGEFILLTAFPVEASADDSAE